MVAGDGSQVVVVMMVQASELSTNQSDALMLSGDARAYAVDQDDIFGGNSKIRGRS